MDYTAHQVRAAECTSKRLPPSKAPTTTAVFRVAWIYFKQFLLFGVNIKKKNDFHWVKNKQTNKNTSAQSSFGVFKKKPFHFFFNSECFTPRMSFTKSLSPVSATYAATVPPSPMVCRQRDRDLRQKHHFNLSTVLVVIKTE